MEKSQRPLIDRPRYVSKPPNVVNAKNSNKPVNKKNLNKQQAKRKVIDKHTQHQMQQPVSGSMNKIDEDVKVKSTVKPKSSQNKKTKKPPMPPREPKAPKEDRNDNSLFKQMKDKFAGKTKDKGGN
tara:strand:- start:75 stop:452 length:378 start_codon:yes stop_codon:yes gene_type:complete